MSKCFKCKKEIDVLDYFRKCWTKSRFTVNEKGYADYEFIDTLDSEEEEYECSECGEILFRDEKDATKFLKGGKKNVRK